MTDAERRLREKVERAESFSARGVDIETADLRAVLDDLQALWQRPDRTCKMCGGGGLLRQIPCHYCWPSKVPHD